MSWVYILESTVNGKFYIGCTDNYRRRFSEHNSGKVKSTSADRPWRIRLVEEYPTLRQARKIEYKLKKLKRKDYIRKIVEDGFIKLRA